MMTEPAAARILIVEDDPDIASLLRRGLGAAGYAADWAETAEAALAAAEAGGVAGSWSPTMTRVGAPKVKAYSPFLLLARSIALRRLL